MGEKANYTFEQMRRLIERIAARFADDPFVRALLATLLPPKPPTRPGEMVVVGVRHEGIEESYRENHADDAIYVVRLATDGGSRQVKRYLGTTESGKFVNQINPAGDFKMLPGVYYFKRDLHYGKYPCLVQAAPVHGQRARNGEVYAGDFTVDDGTLHIHADKLSPDTVGLWSAGGTVIAGGLDGEPWQEFWRSVTRSPQRIFPYILVDEADLPGLIGA